MDAPPTSPPPSPTSIPPTPIPPTPTIAPPEALAIYLEGAVVESQDSFDRPGDPPRGWEGDTGEIADGVLRVDGLGNWNGIAKTGQYSTGDAFLFKFKYSPDALLEMYIDSGQWATDSYRRFGIYVERYPTANTWIADNYFTGNLIGNYRPKPDTWYYVLIAIGPEADFLAVMWEPAEPANAVRYEEHLGDEWADLNWRFAFGADRGSASYDDFTELRFATLN
jgi:hypothetical protein